MNAPHPRLEPLPPGQWTEEQRELLALPLKGHEQTKVSPFFATLVRHPGLYRRYAAFAGKLLVGGKLSVRDRELAVLRNAWLCQAPFEWGEHVQIARDAGMGREEIERVTHGSYDADWNEHDRAVLRAVEELHGEGVISGETWAALARGFDDAQLIELPMLIGCYQMIAYVQNSLGIRLREGNLGLAAR